MKSEEVKKLANLARISISDSEAESLSHEFDAILGYVGEVKSASYDQKLSNESVQSALREDSEPHESGIYTAKILAQAPAREGDYIKVKKIL